MSEAWSHTPIKQVMLKQPAILESTAVRDAIEQLQDPKAHCLMVVDKSGTLLGLFTEKDVVNKVIGHHVMGEEPVKDFLEPHDLNLNEEATIAEAIDMMGNRSLRYLALCDENNKPSGLFSIRELIHYIVDKTKTESGKIKAIDEGENASFGGSQSAIMEVLNLPIEFALSRYGNANPVKLSTEDSMLEALKRISESGRRAALVYQEGKPQGLFRIRDVPFKFIFQDQGLKEVLVKEKMTTVPQVVKENDTIGIGMQKMVEHQSLFLKYQTVEGKDALMTAGGLITYLYSHIYDDE